MRSHDNIHSLKTTDNMIQVEGFNLWVCNNYLTATIGMA